MTSEDRLKAALGLGAAVPAQVDHAFVSRVAEQIEARRFKLRLAVLALWAGVATLLGWVLAPVVVQIGRDAASSLQPIAAGLLLAGVVWWLRKASVGGALRLARRVVRPGLH
jgi:hypothetical protein